MEIILLKAQEIKKYAQELILLGQKESAAPQAAPQRQTTNLTTQASQNGGNGMNQQQYQQVHLQPQLQQKFQTSIQQQALQGQQQQRIHIQHQQHQQQLQQQQQIQQQNQLKPQTVPHKMTSAPPQPLTTTPAAPPKPTIKTAEDSFVFAKNSMADLVNLDKASIAENSSNLLENSFGRLSERRDANGAWTDEIGDWLGLGEDVAPGVNVILEVSPFVKPESIKGTPVSENLASPTSTVPATTGASIVPLKPQQRLFDDPFEIFEDLDAIYPVTPPHGEHSPGKRNIDLENDDSSFITSRKRTKSSGEDVSILTPESPLDRTPSPIMDLDREITSLQTEGYSVDVMDMAMLGIGGNKKIIVSNKNMMVMVSFADYILKGIDECEVVQGERRKEEDVRKRLREGRCGLTDIVRVVTAE